MAVLFRLIANHKIHREVKNITEELIDECKTLKWWIYEKLGC